MGSGEMRADVKADIRNAAHGKIAEPTKTGLSTKNSNAKPITSAFIAAPAPISVPRADFVSSKRGSHEDRIRKTARTARRIPTANAMPNEATPMAAPSKAAASPFPIKGIISPIPTTYEFSPSYAVPALGFYPLRGQISRAWPRRNNIGSSRYRFEGAYLLCRHACYILLAPIRSHGGNSKHPECASRAAHQQVGSNCSEDSHRKTQKTHNHHSSYRKNTRIAGSHRAVSIRFPRRPLATV